MFRTLAFMLLAAEFLSGCSAPPVGDAGPNTPGWTGRSVVLGSTSTIAGDAQATYDQQKWQMGRQR
jgi:hypothetical protein